MGYLRIYYLLLFVLFIALNMYNFIIIIKLKYWSKYYYYSELRRIPCRETKGIVKNKKKLPSSSHFLGCSCRFDGPPSNRLGGPHVILPLALPSTIFTVATNILLCDALCN